MLNPIIITNYDFRNYNCLFMAWTGIEGRRKHPLKTIRVNNRLIGRPSLPIRHKRKQKMKEKTPYDIMKQEERITRYILKTRGAKALAPMLKVKAIAERYYKNIEQYVGYIVYCPDYTPAFAGLTREIYAK